jgi:hypothetical protein
VDDVVRQTIRVEKESQTKPINTPLQWDSQFFLNKNMEMTVLFWIDHYFI